MRKLVLNKVITGRRRLYLELASMYLDGTIKDEIPKLPAKLIPEEHGEGRIRVFYEREIMKEKIKYALCLDHSKVKNLELYEIKDELDSILDGDSELIDREKEIDIIDKVCNECPGGRFYVTDLCRNCVARSCMSSCPKNAIKLVGGKVSIDQNLCVKCGMCEKACPYHAIMKLGTPCELACGASALQRKDEGTMSVKQDNCVSCGACYVECPFGAIETPSQMMQVLHKIESKEEVIAIFAPAAVAQFGRMVNMNQFKEALVEFGFASAVEVTVGADIVAEKEAQHLLDHPDETMLTSCCPSFVSHIRKNHEQLADMISPVASPMIETYLKIKEENPNAKVVFIGPCISKKKEARENTMPDYVITFEEMASLFAAKKIEPGEMKGFDLSDSTSEAWKFASSGGVTNAVVHYLKELTGKDTVQINAEIANGLKECDSKLKEIKNKKICPNVLEGMACFGGCISGPGVLIDPKIANISLKKM